MKRIIIAFILVLDIFMDVQAQTGISAAVKENIKARVDKRINTGIVIGLIDDNGSHFYSYGLRSMEGTDSVNEYSVFEIGSISKTFTGILLADMVIKGEVSLDDPIQNYLPPGVTAPTVHGASIRLVHLSNHTSSLPRMPDNFTPANPANPYADYSEKQLYEFLNNCKLTRDIGSEYEYSNYAAGLLGHIMATKRQSTYEELMIDVIARPLDLKDTRVNLTPSMKANLARGHAQGIQVENWDLNILAGAGGVRSTAVDMLKYLAANMGKGSSDLYPAMQRSHENSRREGSIPMVGLGWHKAGSGESEIIWHNGGTGGYRAFAGFNTKGDKGVVVLSNSSASVDDIGMHLLNPASPLKEIKSFDAKPTSEVTEQVVVDIETLDRYVGQYELAPGFILTVSRDDTQLKAQATGQPQFPIFPKAVNVFFLKVVEAQLTFNQDAEAKVQSVTLHQAGQEITGRKIR